MTEQLTIGVDLGGTSIKYAVVNGTGKVVWENKKPTEAGQTRKELIERIADCVREAKTFADNFGQIMSVGIGTSGLVDIEKGLVMGGAPNLPDWENLPLASIISEMVALPVFVDNDANLMGLGEYIFGLNGEGENLIFLTIGTGIGGAMVINGQLYRGFRYAGGELGCLPMNYGGQSGYWEDFASTTALVAQYESGRQQQTDLPVDGKFIVEEFLKGDKLANKVMHDHTHLVGIGVAGLINIFNPEYVVIGGGISEAGDFYINQITAAAKQHAMQDCFAGVKITAARLGNKAGFLGAGYFALDQINKQRS